MKRNARLHDPHARQSSIVKLNVGGKRFDVSRGTLLKIPWFEPIVSGRFASTVDENDNFFIDRSPILFGIILQAIRTGSRPGPTAIQQHAHDLVAESEYFCIDWLTESLRGKPSSNQLPGVIIMIRELETALRQLYEGSPSPTPVLSDTIFDVHKIDIMPADSEGLDMPLLLHASRKPLGRLATRDEFEKNFDNFSGGLLADLKKIQGVVIAGGCVLSCLLGVHAGDIDIFIIDSTRSTEIFGQVFKAIQRNQAQRHTPESKMLVTRSRNAVTFYRMGVDGRCMIPPVQIILATYTDPVQVLIHFDVDACCLAWDPQGGEVMATRRAITALQYKVNVADDALESTAYFHRLEKYAHRGFAIAVPGFSEWHVRDDVKKASYILVEDLDLLLKVGDITPGSVSLQYGRARAGSVQPGTIIRDLARIFTLTYLRYKKIRTSSILLQPSGRTGRVFLYREVKRTDHVQECDLTSDDSSDDALYAGPSKKTIHALMTEAFREDLRREGAAGEDSWCKGGAMQRISYYMTSGKMHQVLTIANEALMQRSLSFVFDFIACTREWQHLRFVLDAARRPLPDIPDNDFYECYGLPRRLRFTAYEKRQTRQSDWWADLYRQL